MAVRLVTAPPGKGKTLNLTKIAIDLYKQENNFLDRMKKNYIHYVNIYSNYPILLWFQKKPFLVCRNEGEIEKSLPLKYVYNRELKQSMYVVCDEKDCEVYGVFSNKISFTDMTLRYKFNYNSSFFIDEIQYIYDSQDYRDFPDAIAHFFQVHRHLNYNFIYTNSQSISRVIKRVLNVSEEFWNVEELKQYKLLPMLSKCKIKIAYDVSTYANHENSKTETISFDYITQLFFNKRVYRGYCTKYLNALNDGLELYHNEGYNSLLISKKDIISNFNVSRETKEELLKLDF